MCRNTKEEIVKYIKQYMSKMSFATGSNDLDFINNNFLIYNEISLQHHLGIYLRKKLRDCAVLFERNINSYCDGKDFCKAEIDIVITNQENEHYAIELKVPLNNETTEQTKELLTDIYFMEQVKKAGFNNTFVLTTTNDSKFWEKPNTKKGRKPTIDLYKYFRDTVEEIPENFEFEKGEEDKTLNTIRIKNKYKIEWIDLKEKDGKYYFMEIK